jgi:cysteine sulfinate desulfinase/cysteine desulfurase-like protein
MDEAGFSISTRSACETDSQEGSRAVFALTGDRERAFSTLRFSWGSDISRSDLLAAAQALIEAVRFVDSHKER